MLKEHAKNNCPHLPYWAYRCLKQTDKDAVKGDTLYTEIVALVDDHFAGFDVRDWLNLECELKVQLGIRPKHPVSMHNHTLADWWWLVESIIIEHTVWIAPLKAAV